MTVRRKTIEVVTRGRGLYDIGDDVGEVVASCGVSEGLCNVFVAHTSASVIVSENADPAVGRDLNRFFARLVPDADPAYEHASEGPDDMAAHVRSVLTQCDVTVPVGQARCLLGIWQSIYLWEHRTASHRRRIVVTVLGQ